MRLARLRMAGRFQWVNAFEAGRVETSTGRGLLFFGKNSLQSLGASRRGQASRAAQEEIVRAVIGARSLDRNGPDQIWRLSTCVSTLHA